MKSTILLLDDERDNLIILENVIKGLDFPVDTVSFTSSREALAWCWCCQHGPDLCLVDYMMPVMDGLDFITAARKLSGFHNIPIVLITGASDRTLRDHALAQGATDFWTKPIDPTEARVRLSEFLDHGNPGNPLHHGDLLSLGLGQVG